MKINLMKFLKYQIKIMTTQEVGVSVKFDGRKTHRPGAKFASMSFKEFFEVAIGPKDLKNGTSSSETR